MVKLSTTLIDVSVSTAAYYCTCPCYIESSFAVYFFLLLSFRLLFILSALPAAGKQCSLQIMDDNFLPLCGLLQISHLPVSFTPQHEILKWLKLHVCYCLSPVSCLIVFIFLFLTRRDVSKIHTSCMSICAWEGNIPAFWSLRDFINKFVWYFYFVFTFCQPSYTFNIKTNSRYKHWENESYNTPTLDDHFYHWAFLPDFLEQCAA